MARSRSDSTRRSVLRTTGTALLALGGAGLATNSASAELPLSVHTHPASDVNTTYATLNGEIEWMGGDASWVTVWFEWGEEGNGMPNSTDSQTYFSPTTFDDLVDGLDPGVTYEFEVHAENSIDYTDTGGTHTFTTPS